MNEKREQRIKKLPQWAQMYIGKLQRDNEALVAERGKIADGDAKVTFSMNFDEAHGIPDRATVSFELENGVLEFSLHDNGVRVRSTLQRLAIRPEASNAINLTIRRWL